MRCKKTKPKNTYSYSYSSIMPNLYVPEDVFKKYVDKYGYDKVKEKMINLLRDIIDEKKIESHNARDG